MLICSKCGSNHLKKNGFQNGKQRYKCVDCGSQYTPIDTSDYVLMSKENVRLAKRSQKFQDKNRIENKSFRSIARIDNALIEYLDALHNIINDNKITIDVPKAKTNIKDGSVAIVHLSDLHLNELVDIIGNIYDFNIASKRLYLFVEKIMYYIKDRSISMIYVVMTGDLLNSDRRLDELLSMATNRAQATFLAVKLLASFLIHLYKIKKVPIKVISVTGNESRINEEYTQLDSMATDNFDFIIYEMLKLYMSNLKHKIEFISGRTFEYILEIYGKTFLIVHGHRLGKMNYNDLSKAISKWVKKDVLVNVIVCGHLHEANITDTLFRSGSLVGNNAYSDVGLNLHSHASQNFYIVHPDGSIDATKIDLQYVNEESPMYDVEKDLEAYNSKSIDKLRYKRTIMEIVI